MLSHNAGFTEWWMKNKENLYFLPHLIIVPQIVED